VVAAQHESFGSCWCVCVESSDSGQGLPPVLGRSVRSVLGLCSCGRLGSCAAKAGGMAARAGMAFMLVASGGEAIADMEEQTAAF